MVYDIVIIGSGPGGYGAAIRGAQLGAKVCVVEKAEVGGTCVNRGCIPTKVLLAGAAKIAEIRGAEEFGINVQGVTIDYAKLAAKKDTVIRESVEGIKYLFNKHGVTLVQGTAKLSARNKVTVTTNNGEEMQVNGKNIIIATGSRPADMQGIDYIPGRIINTDEALQLEKLPTSVILLGGGVIGCEFASLYHELGVKVVILEKEKTLLPTMDKEVSRQLQSIFRQKGIEVRTNSEVVEVNLNHQELKVQLNGGKEITGELLITCAGRILNTDDLGLEALGLETGVSHELLVNEYLETNIPHIYAIGDITAKVKLAHVASVQGIRAVENIMGLRKTIDYDVVPTCVYTIPEIASVGLTTQEADAKGFGYKVGKVPFLFNGRAKAMGETQGFVKVIAQVDRDKILGVHIIGAHATELISEAVVAMASGLTATELCALIHPHPTLSETLMAAAGAVTNQAIHI